MGFNYENVWTVNIHYPEGISSPDSMQQYQQTLKQLIKSMPQVNEVSFASSNVPFAGSMMSSMVSYNKNEIQANTYNLEDSYFKVLNLSMKEGRWFTNADNAVKEKPVVINETLKDKLFGNENPIGKIITPDNMKVIGVVTDFKDKGDYQAIESGYYRRADTANVWSLGSILVAVKANTNAAFEARLYKTVSNYLNTSNLEIEHLSKKRVSKNNATLVPMIILLIVAGFLIINVALGLFGVLWYNISRRRGEIGLRRAVGATGKSVENKFLKNHLSQNGYKVVVRTAISKNKYLKEYLNTASLSLDRINSSLLDKFDIIIADATELAAIPKSELAAIETQVAQKSIGLIIKADSAFSGSSFYSDKFQLKIAAGDSGQQVNLYLLDSAGKMPATTIGNHVFIQNQTATQPLVFDKQNSIYVNSTLYGSGKIILTTLTNTYNWALSGNQNDYNKFWAELLNKAAPKPAREELWSISPALPQINKPVQLQVQTNNTGILQGQVNGNPVYLRANYDLPYQWTGTYYPVKQGWQTGIQLNGNSFFWYAYNKNDWQNIFASEKIKAAKQYISKKLNKTKSGGKSFKTIDSQIEKGFFFLIFLLSCGFLWLEDKFF